MDADERRRRDRERKRQWRASHGDEHRARSRAYAAAHREQEAARAQAWRDADPERVRQTARNYRKKLHENWPAFLAKLRKRYHKNPKPQLDRQRQARQEYPERFAATQRKHYRANKSEYVARVALRKALRLQATPSWCDRKAVAAVYREARRMTLETGIKHEVDHIVPLQGKMVCGLHIPINLQIITRSKNRRKANRLEHEAAD